jgi:hypothetical protein
VSELCQRALPLVEETKKEKRLPDFPSWQTHLRLIMLSYHIIRFCFLSIFAVMLLF